MWFLILPIVVLLALLFLWCLKGRLGHPKLQHLKTWKYAHRGLHDDKKPENSMSAFRAALDAGYGIELDIHLLKDGNLAVMHDSSLKRTAGVDIRIEDLTTEELTNYALIGTGECIPQFRQVLELFDGKAPLIVELKVVNHNYKELSIAVSRMLDAYNGLYCIESFDPRVVAWFRKNRPDVVRGQLSENWFKSNASMPAILKWILTHLVGNILTRPDFIAYKFVDRNTVSAKLCRKLWRIQGVSWTLKTPEEYETAVQEGWIPIFEGFTP